MIPETIYSKYSQAMFDIASEQKKLTEFVTERRAGHVPGKSRFVEIPESSPRTAAV